MLNRCELLGGAAGERFRLGSDVQGGIHDRLVASGEPIPTILITAFPDERARERALHAGVICYLAKPFSEDDLLACIRSTLGRRKARGKGS